MDRRHREDPSSAGPLTPDELKQWRRVTDERYQELLRLGMPVVHTDAGDRHSKADVHRWFAVVPPGSPKWITSDDIEETIRVRQPNYRPLLTAKDALEILINTHALIDVLVLSVKDPAKTHFWGMLPNPRKNFQIKCEKWLTLTIVPLICHRSAQTQSGKFLSRRKFGAGPHEGWLSK